RNEQSSLHKKIPIRRSANPVPNGTATVYAIRRNRSLRFPAVEPISFRKLRFRHTLHTAWAAYEAEGGSNLRAPRRASVCPEIRRPHHLPPLFGFIRNMLREIGW